MYTRYSTMILDEEMCASLELLSRIPYKYFPHLEHCWTTSTTELAKELEDKDKQENRLVPSLRDYL